MIIWLMYCVLSSLCQGRTCLGGAQLWGYREANLIFNNESMYFYIFVHVSYARVLKLCENPASVSVTQSYLFSYLILVIILMTKAIHLIVCLMFWLLTILFIFEIAIFEFDFKQNSSNFMQFAPHLYWNWFGCCIIFCTNIRKSRSENNLRYLG